MGTGSVELADMRKVSKLGRSMLPFPGRFLLVLLFSAVVSAASAASGPTLKDDELMESAIADYNRNDYASAEEKLTELVARRPDLKEGYLNRALARSELGKFAEAESDLDMLLSIDPKSAVAFEFRAMLRLQRSNVAGALADANVGLRIEDRPGLRSVRGRILTAKGDYEEALKDLERALAANEDDDDARFARGDCCLALGRFKEACADFEDILEYYPESIAAMDKLGSARFKLLEFKEAIGLLEQLTEVDRPRARAWRMVGYSHFGAGNYQRAIEAMERSLAAESVTFPWAAAVLHLAWLSEKRETESPLAGLVDRIEDPWGKAVCQALLKQISEDELIEEATALEDPEKQRGRLCEAYFYLGAMRLRSGDRIGGRALLAQAIATESISFIEYTLAQAELGRKP